MYHIYTYYIFPRIRLNIQYIFMLCFYFPSCTLLGLTILYIIYPHLTLDMCCIIIIFSLSIRMGTPREEGIGFLPGSILSTEVSVRFMVGA